MKIPRDDWGELANWSIQQDLMDKQDGEWLEKNYSNAYLFIRTKENVQDWSNY